MIFDEFNKKVVQNLKPMLPERVHVELHNATKNNNTEVVGIMIKSEDNALAPIIYLEACYKLYKEGMEFEEILKQIYRVWEENCKKNSGLQVESLLNKEKMKEHVMLKLINYKENEELLKKVPHRKFLDLAIVYYFMIDMGKDETGTILVNHLYCNELKMNEEELYHCACKNYLKQMSVMVESLDNIIAKVLGCDLGAEWLVEEAKNLCRMYIITNKKGFNGAVSMLFFNEYVKQFDILQQDLYIFPSSVHEVLVVPIFTEEKEELKSIVWDINRTEVSKEERLSDNVYRYYHKDGTIEIV